MSFIAGDILIKMAADVASLRKDMDNAKGVVEQATMVMKTAAVAVAGAFSASMFAGWIKSAIDAGDEMNKLSQRTGIAVEDIGGLQLAFRLGGAESGAFATAMGKLSKQIVEGNDAFKYLGVTVREADGTVRGAKDVLYDVADAFKGAEDGAGKSALAMEIFGKSGAELIPILNTGSEGLREMDEISRKLGLTMDAETAASAEKFNDTLDLIGLSSQGVARQLAAQLLPTLTNLAGAFFETVTQGDTLSKLAGVLSAALKGLFTAAAVGVEIFNTLGKTVGANLATIAAVARGDFSAAGKIITEYASDIRRDWSETATTLQKVWTDSGGKTVESMVAVGGALKKLTPLTKEQEEAAKKAAEAAKKQAEEMDKLAEATKLENAGLSGDYLKKLRELVALRDSGRLSTDEYVKAVEELIKKQPVVKKQMDDEKKAAEELEKALAAGAAATTKYEQAVVAETEALRKSVVQLKEQNETAGLNERQIVDREAAILRSRATELEWQAAMEGGNEQLSEQARLLRERAGLLEQGIVAKEARAAADAWKETAKSIEDGLTDALMRGFESGKSFTENIVSYIKNAFKTLVADFIIRPIIAPVAGGMASLFSGNAFAGGGGGGLGGIFSGLSNFLNGSTISGGIGGAFNSFATSNLGASLGLSTPIDFGTGFTANIASSGANMLGSIAGGLGNGFAGYGISKALSGGYTTGGNTVNALAGIASAFFGPIAGVIGGVINRAFGRKLADQGVEGTFGGGDFSGQNFAFYKGGWFRSDKTKYSDMDAELEQSLSAGAAAIFNQTKGYAEALGLPGEVLNDVTTTMKISLTDDAEKNQQLIADAMKEYGDTLAATYAPLLAPFEKAGESVAKTLERLVGMRVLAENLNQFGGVFSRIATASYGAQDALIGLAGGMENLATMAAEFVNLYYSDAEKAGMQARAVANTLAQYGFTEDDLRAAGIDATDKITKEEFRALVESRDVETELGREQLVALLAVANQFAQLANYMDSADVSFKELLDAAPTTAILDEMFDPAKATADNTLEISTAMTTSNGHLSELVTKITAIDVSASASSIAAQAAANAAAAAAAAATAAVEAINLANAEPNYSYDIGAGS